MTTTYKKQDLKQIFIEFKGLAGNPLKQKNSIPQFIRDDNKKSLFLQGVKTFRKQYPTLNFADFLQIYDEKDHYKLDALIEFIKQPTERTPLVELIKEEKDKDTLDAAISQFKPAKFEVFNSEGQLKDIIYDKSKPPPVSDVDISAVAEVVSKPKIRGSQKAKEMKEEQEEKERGEQREDITQRVEKVKMDKEGNIIENEDSPRVLTKEEEEEEKEAEKPPETATPATISPDERDEKKLDDFVGNIMKESIKELEEDESIVAKSLDDMIKKMEEQMEAEQDAKKREVLRQQIEKAKAEAEEKRQSDIATMTLGKGSATGKVEEMEIKDVPQDIRAIPKERASTTGKSEAQLKDDINYFFKTYPDMLKKERGQYLTIIRGKSPALRKKQLIELHRRIVGLVGNVEENGIGKNIGIVLNADKYLDDKINAILLQKITDGMKPASLVVNVTDKTKDDKSKRVGSYQITKGRSGLLNAQKAPVYRSIPSTNDSQDRRSNRPIKLKTLPTQRWDEVNTAKKQMRLDPFEPKREKVNRFDIYL